MFFNANSVITWINKIKMLHLLKIIKMPFFMFLRVSRLWSEQEIFTAVVWPCLFSSFQTYITYYDVGWGKVNGRYFRYSNTGVL